MKRTCSPSEDNIRKRTRNDVSDAMPPPPEQLFAKPFEDWDDELNGDLLEEACIIAELSQVPKPTKLETNGECSLNSRRENETLSELLKTREGEVGVLRSQLDRLHRAKQKEVQDHRSALNELKKKCELDVSAERKQCETLKNELEFKDLEIKELRDKCKKLEIRSPKVRYIEPVQSEEKNLFSLSQAISSSKSKQTAPLVENTIFKVPKRDKPAEHCGLSLSKLVTQNFFIPNNEPNVVQIFNTFQKPSRDIDRGKRQRYMWVNVPSHPPRLQELYPIVIEMYQQEIFLTNSLSQLSTIALDIINHLKDLLVFLSKLAISTEHDKALLDDLDPGVVISLEDLMSERILKNDEVGVETRRTLGLLSCLLKSSKTSVAVLPVKLLLENMKEIVVLIGRILRPVEFSGIIIGVLMFLQAFLECSALIEVDYSLHRIICTIIEEVIFSRSKLNVLREIVMVIACCAHAPTINNLLCRKSKSETCTLYMDVKLRQAMFFSRDACPIRILQLQIKTLAHLCQASAAILDITQVIAGCLHCLLSRGNDLPSWIIPESELCCDILECFCYLLMLCVPYALNDVDFLNVVEEGVITLRDCCKCKDRKITSSTLKLLPSSLRSSGVMDKMSTCAKEASYWVIKEYDTQVHHQESLGRSICSNEVVPISASTVNLR